MAQRRTRVPKRYVPKILSTKDKKIQKKELKKSRRLYKQGKYHTRRRARSFRSKPSRHTMNAKIIYGVDCMRPNRTLARKTGCSVKALEEIVKKGQGAYYSSGSRPNQSAHSWGYARLASAITGGKSAAVDYKILEKGCKKTSKALRYAKQARRKHGKGTRKVRGILI